jgi:hypothetical protein
VSTEYWIGSRMIQELFLFQQEKMVFLFPFYFSFIYICCQVEDKIEELCGDPQHLDTVLLTRALKRK